MTGRPKNPMGRMPSRVIREGVVLDICTAPGRWTERQLLQGHGLGILESMVCLPAEWSTAGPAGPLGTAPPQRNGLAAVYHHSTGCCENRTRGETARQNRPTLHQVAAPDWVGSGAGVSAERS